MIIPTITPLFSNTFVNTTRSNTPKDNTPLLHFTAQQEQPSQTLESIQQILDDIEYKDGFFFALNEDEHGEITVKVHYVAPDVYNPTSPNTLRTETRPWQINPNSSGGQIAQTLLVALKSVEEHELRENFYFDGLRLFDPHFNQGELTDYLMARSTEDTEQTATPLNGYDDVKAIINKCTLHGFQLGLDQFSYDPHDRDMFHLTVKITQNPTSQHQESALTEGLDGKKITFATTGKKSNLLYNLMDALIQESEKEIKDRLRYKGFARFSNRVPIEHLEAYTRLNRFA